MAFERSKLVSVTESTTAAPAQEKGKSKRPANGKMLRLTFKSGSKESGEEKMSLILHERVSATGNQFFMGNPANKLEDGTYQNEETVFYFMPRRDGSAVVRVQEVKGGPINDVVTLRSGKDEGTYFGFIKQPNGDTRVYIDPFVKKAAE